MGMTIRTNYGIYEGVVLRVSKYMADESIAVMAENQQDGPIATRAWERMRRMLIRITVRGRWISSRSISWGLRQAEPDGVVFANIR